jgi:hypothetical protein
MYVEALLGSFTSRERVCICNFECLNSPSIASIAQSRLGIRAKSLGTADAPVSRFGQQDCVMSKHTLAAFGDRRW